MSNLTTVRELKGLLDNPLVQEKLKAIVGKNIGAFTTSVVQITSQNDMLSKAEPNSILGAAMTAATLNLPLNNALGFCYVVPFNEKQKDGSYKVKAQFILGSKGYIQLAQRSNQFETLHTTDVREGEILSKNRLTGKIEFQWTEDDDERNKKQIIGYVAYFKLLNGYEDTLFMTAKEMEAHAKKFSQTYKKGFGVWKDDFPAMATKTMIKLLLSKKAPLSIELETAVRTDQAIVNELGEAEDVTYADNETPEVDPELERMKLLVDDVKTMEDAEFAQEHVTDPVLIAELDLKIIQIKKAAKTDKK